MKKKILGLVLGVVVVSSCEGMHFSPTPDARPPAARLQEYALAAQAAWGAALGAPAIVVPVVVVPPAPIVLVPAVVPAVVGGIGPVPVAAVAAARARAADIE